MLPKKTFKKIEYIKRELKTAITNQHTQYQEVDKNIRCHEKKHNKNRF